MHALKVGDIVNRGDVILTTQDGIVELAPERGTGVATTSPNDVDRVITGLNESNPSDAPAAVLGGDGAGDLTPGLRVDRVVESINSAALAQSSPALNGPISAAFNNNLGAPENLNPPAAPGIVNIAPSGTAVAVSGLEDSTLPVTLAGHDPDGSIVAVTVTTIPAGSQLLLADGVTPVVAGQALTPAQAGNLLFKPGPDFNGSTAITFTVTDDAGAVSGSTSVSFNVVAVNDAPIGVADAASVVEDTPLSGNVIVNDVDVDGPALSVTSFSVAGASHAAGTTADLPGIGTLLINADGGLQRQRTDQLQRRRFARRELDGERDGQRGQQHAADRHRQFRLAGRRHELHARRGGLRLRRRRRGADLRQRSHRQLAARRHAAAQRHAGVGRRRDPGR